MTAAAAAGALGVTRATLYAYVSRGLVRSQATAGSSRARGYAREDVERLRRRTEERRDPDKAAARALQWGVPGARVVDHVDRRAAVSTTAGTTRWRWRETRSVQEVASLIWTGGFDSAFPARPVAAAAVREGRDPPSVRGARPGGAGARVGARRDLLRCAIGQGRAHRLADSPTADHSRHPRGRRRFNDRSRAGAGLARQGPGRRPGARRADPLRRSRAQRLVVHRPLRRLGGLESIRGGDRRALGARGHEARRGQRAGGVAARVAAAHAGSARRRRRAAAPRRDDRRLRAPAIPRRRSTRADADRGTAPRTTLDRRS